LTKIRQRTWNNTMFGIANAQGDPWSPRVFVSREAAQAFLDAENREPLDLSKHSVVPVSVTVRCIGSTK